MPFIPDPQIQAAFAQVVSTAAAAAPASDGPDPDSIEGRRLGFAKWMGLIAPQWSKEVTKKDLVVTGSDGHEIKCRFYEKQGSPQGGAGILYLHGGGYVVGGGLDVYDGVVGKIVRDTGVPVFAADYRLAPEAQYPTNVDDAHRAFLYLFDHAAEFGIDANRIAVMGDSAGGGLAAALVHYNIEKKGPRIAKQILVYPMIDDRNIHPDPDINDIALFKAEQNKNGWEALIGSKRGQDGVKPSAAPARMTKTDAKQLPPTFIDVGELDIFRDECIEYAQKLYQAGISCDFHVYTGCIHGFDFVAQEADVSQKAFQNRYQAIKTI